jgi:hypothetical protein
MKAVLKSRETKRSFEGGTGTLVVIGRDVALRDRYEVLQKETFAVDVPAQGTFEHASPEITMVYDNILYKDGTKYQGFIFTVRDASGQVQIIEASPADYAKLADRSLGLKVGQSVDRQLMPMNIRR